MDEPFSALDVLTAENLRNELKELWFNKTMPTTAIFIVTHNIEEAVLLADRIVVLGRNPGRIRSDFEVTLPQWRDRKSSRFLGLVDYIYMVMTQPEVEHTLPTAPVERTRPAKAKYPMLPHARPGGIAGLLEILEDSGGREDLYRLAEESGMNVDDVLPIIEAASLLGFAGLHEGDVAITSEGRSFVDADIQTRKLLFRDAALKNVVILQQMDSV
jgi:NitT/TauT family transport system ATP-binding protein